LTALSSGVPDGAVKWMFLRMSWTLSPTRWNTSTHSSPTFSGRPAFAEPRAIIIGARIGCSSTIGLISA
jgi:hypothetical protein